MVTPIHMTVTIIVRERRDRQTFAFLLPPDAHVALPAMARAHGLSGTPFTRRGIALRVCRDARHTSREHEKAGSEKAHQRGVRSLGSFVHSTAPCGGNRKWRTGRWRTTTGAVLRDGIGMRYACSQYTRSGEQEEVGMACGYSTDDVTTSVTIHTFAHMRDHVRGAPAEVQR